MLPTRTDEDVGLRIEGEVGASEKAFGPVLAIQQRNTWLALRCISQPIISPAP
jgi:hypothetical protein